MLIDVIKIIRECVDNIDNTIKFIVDSDTLLTCDTSYVNVGDVITIGSEDYTVISVNIDVSITLDRDVFDSDITTATIKNAKFRHGTISSVNSELVKDLGKDPIENYPLVFLLEELEINYNINSIPYANSLVKLFFIAQTDYNNYTINQHHTNTIDPLKNLVDRFLYSVKKNKSIEGLSITNFTTNLHPVFGYTDQNGYTENYLNDNLSAIQLTIDIPFKKGVCCKN